jgi:hypothetical protein
LIIYTNSVDSNGLPVVPPDNLDWFGVDRFFDPGFDNAGCAERDAFEAGPLAQLRFAAEWAAQAHPEAGMDRRVLVFAPSFQTASLAMPSTCQQRWFLEAAMEEREVVGLVWFMYGRAEGSGILGAAPFPDVTGLHRLLFDNFSFGGWGVQLAVGDVDGTGGQEIVVARGAGLPNLTVLQVFSPSGEELSRSEELFPGLRFGLNLALARTE